MARTVHRRLLAAAIGTLLAFVAAELVMQVAAFGLWLAGGRDRPAPAGAGREVVLAVGDSFTFGLGASDVEHAYPAALQALLDERRPDTWHVVNAGKPGADSADVLRRLPLLLRRHAPRHVVILVGYNDRWSTPRRLTAADLSVDDDATAFELRLRTVAVAGRVIDWLEGEPPADPAELHGHWQAKDFRATFGRDGICVIAGVATPYRVAGDTLWVGEEAGEPYRWDVAGDTLQLRGGRLGPAGITLQRATTNDAIPTTANGRLLEAVAAAPPLDAAGVRAACAELADEPAESVLWWRTIAAGRRGIEPELILRTIASALERLPADDAWRAGLLRARAGLLEDRDRDAALDAILRAWVIDRHRPAVTAMLRTRFPGRERRALRHALDRLDLDADTRRLATEAFAASGDAATTVPAVLRDHLVLAARLCREAGATPWLVDYPEPVPDVTVAIAAAAERAGAPHVEVTAAFAEALRTRSRPSLFVSDGHCNDAGYALLAETVGRRLLAEARDESSQGK